MSTQTQTQIQPQTKHHIKLASAEVANIWTSYMNDSMASCVVGSFLSHTEDTEIRSVLDFALKISQAHIDNYNPSSTKNIYPFQMLCQ